MWAAKELIRRQGEDVATLRREDVMSHKRRRRRKRGGGSGGGGGGGSGGREERGGNGERGSGGGAVTKLGEQDLRNVASESDKRGKSVLHNTGVNYDEDENVNILESAEELESFGCRHIQLQQQKQRKQQQQRRQQLQLRRQKQQQQQHRIVDNG